MVIPFLPFKKVLVGFRKSFVFFRNGAVSKFGLVVHVPLALLSMLFRNLHAFRPRTDSVPNRSG